MFYLIKKRTQIKIPWAHAPTKNKIPEPKRPEAITKKPQQNKYNAENKINKLPNIKLDHKTKSKNENKKDNINASHDSEDKYLNEEENYNNKAQANKWDKLINESDDTELVKNINNEKQQINSIIARFLPC